MCDIAAEIEKRSETKGETKTTEKIILTMLKNDFTDEQIKKATNASQDFIDELKEKLDK